MNYNFIQQVNAPNQKEAVRLCQKYEATQGTALIDVSENSEWFKRGVDLYEETPDKPVLIDVKCDERIAQTGNIALELIEISSLNGFIKKGWAYSDIDWIYYVDWHNKKNYKLRLLKILNIAFSKPRYGFSAFHPNEKYFTLGILIPIQELQIQPVSLI